MKHLLLIIFSLVTLTLLASCEQKTDVSRGDPQNVTREVIKAAHQESLFISLQNAKIATQQNNANNLEVQIDGVATNSYIVQNDGIVVDLPNDTKKRATTITVRQGDITITQKVQLLSSLNSQNILSLVDNVSRAEMEQLVDAQGMRLLDFIVHDTQAIAVIDMEEKSSGQALEKLQLTSSSLAQTGRTMVNTVDFRYQQVMHIHSLDPSCDILPNLHHETETWQKLYKEATTGQESLSEALSLDIAHNRGYKGKGVTIFVLDSVDENGQDIFDCPNTSYVDGHGSHLVEIIKYMAPEAEVFTRRVCDSLGRCSSQAIARALWALESRLRAGERIIVNLSLSAAPHPEYGVDMLTYTIIQRFSQQYPNFAISASAGNNGLDGAYHVITPRQPAGFHNGFTNGNGTVPLVNAIASMFSVSTFGLRSGGVFGGVYEMPRFNPRVPSNIVAPGAGLCLSKNCQDGRPAFSGTSFGAAFVTGAAALFWDDNACSALSGSELVRFMAENENVNFKIDDNAIPILSALPLKACPNTTTPPTSPSNVVPVLERSSLSLNVGQSYDLALFIREQDNNFVWGSSQASITKFEGHTVTALAKGTTTLKLYHPSTPEVFASIELSVEGERCTNPPYIPDAALRQQMQEYWHVATITCEVLASQTRLHAFDKRVKDLTGLEHAQNLTWLNISMNPLGQQGTDVLKPVRMLHNLKVLQIHDAALTEVHLVPLNNLSKLEWLSLHSNHIEAITVFNQAYFPLLDALWLYNNQISDISVLSRFTNLYQLHLQMNQISELSPLSVLKNLTFLKLGRNKITDIQALHTLENLDALYLNENKLNSISGIEKVHKLRVLWLYNNNISSLEPLRNLTQMQQISAWGNNISDLRPLVNLRLRKLYLNYNPVNDIAVLESMANMKVLELAHTEVEDISAVASLHELSELVLADSKVKDPRVLGNLDNLLVLDLSGLELENSMLDFLVANVTLEKLNLSSNRLHTIDFVRSLSALQELHLFSNHLTDVQVLLEQSGIASGDIIDIAGNDFLLAEDKTKILGQIAALQARDVIVQVENILQLQPSATMRLQRDTNFSLNGFTNNNENGHHAYLWGNDDNDKEQWFEIFPIGKYRYVDGSHNEQGIMLRRAGTTMCLSANTPQNGRLVTLYRCIASDPYQQWQRRQVGEETLWMIKNVTTGQEFCLNAYIPIASRHVIMWQCGRNDDDQLWQEYVINR